MPFPSTPILATKLRRIRIGVGALALAGAAIAAAAPLDPGLVHADAAWVVHLDNEALNASTLNARVREFDPAAADLNAKEFRDNFGLDPDKDLFGLTIYGGDQGPEDAIVIGDVRTQAADDLPKFLEGKRLAGFTQLDEAGRTFRQWNVEGRPFVMLITPAANDSRRRVIVGATVQGVLKAARVAEGELASQKQLREPTLAMHPSDKAYVFISVRGAASGEPCDAQAALFRSARSITVEMGESKALPAALANPPATPPANPPAANDAAPKPQVYLDVRLDADTEQTAKQLGQVVQGLTSFARLQVAEQKDLQQVVDMLDQVKVTVDAGTVRVHAACDSEGFARMLVNPQVDAYVKALVPNTGGMGLSAPKKTKPSASPMDLAAPKAPSGAREEGAR